MSVRDLLDRISASGSLVPSKATYEGTLEMQERQASSPGSLGSLNNDQEQFAENIELTAVCKCGYRSPFCSCGFYTFPG